MKCKNCVRHVHLNDDGERTVGTPNWCFYLSDSPDEELERDCIAFKCATNADRIRSMTDEELDKFLGNVQWDVANYCGGVTQKQEYPVPEQRGAWLDWLRQEVEDDE